MSEFRKKLRVWWLPQVGVDAVFYIPVDTVEEGKKVMDLLAAYDCFQYNYKIKPDYCNTGGLQMFDEEEGEWVDWEYDDGEDYFDDVDLYCETCSDKAESLKEFAEAVLSQVSFD